MVLNISNILNQSIHKAERVKFKPKRLIIDVDESEMSTGQPEIASSLRLEHRQLTSAVKRSMDQLHTFRSIRGSLSDIRSNLSEMKDLVLNQQASPTLVNDLKEINARVNQVAKDSLLVEKSDPPTLNINPTGEMQDESL